MAKFRLFKLTRDDYDSVRSHLPPGQQKRGVLILMFQFTGGQPDPDLIAFTMQHGHKAVDETHNDRFQVALTPLTGSFVEISEPYVLNNTEIQIEDLEKLKTDFAKPDPDKDYNHFLFTPQLDSIPGDRYQHVKYLVQIDHDKSLAEPIVSGSAFCNPSPPASVR